jgi:hypothetical protein
MEVLRRKALTQNAEQVETSSFSRRHLLKAGHQYVIF